MVGVGRFTSPDTMVSQIKRGVIDFIGAARPSIADPFLPKKIEEGRIDDIRECIGCNMCVSSDFTMVPMRCTQNPTMGEEWRKGWHPEIIPSRKSDDRVLVGRRRSGGIGMCKIAGAIAATRSCSPRRATISAAGVLQESRLPGLAAWRRVRDYRVQQIQRMPNVEVYRESQLSADDIRDYGFPKVVLATGGTWRRDGIGRWRNRPVPGLEQIAVIGPEDVFAGAAIAGPVVIFDDDRYYLGSVLAEALWLRGLEVTLVTPASDVSNWSQATLEQGFAEQRLHEIGVTLIEKHGLVAATKGAVTIEHVVSGRQRSLPCASPLPVTMRLPNDSVFYDLQAAPERLTEAGITSVTRIGDCFAPSTIAAAVYGGHRCAREMDEPPLSDVPFKRELIAMMSARGAQKQNAPRRARFEFYPATLRRGCRPDARSSRWSRESPGPA